MWPNNMLTTLNRKSFKVNSIRSQPLTVLKDNWLNVHVAIRHVRLIMGEHVSWAVKLVSSDGWSSLTGVIVMEITAQSRKLLKDGLLIKGARGGREGLSASQGPEAVTCSVISWCYHLSPSAYIKLLDYADINQMLGQEIISFFKALHTGL